ncbi:MAG: 6-phosphogluconate dehydrogenase [Flavobacteriales bacterium]|nr:6-phosphogluconate dehydrogenase [Flavobacteriales bacterium]
METSQENQEKFADKAKRKARNFFRWFVAMVLLLVIGFGLFVVFVPYSEGVRAGTVLKVSKRGVIFKTYEGQLDLETFGASLDSKNPFSQAFMFSVREAQVVKDLEAVSLSGERVNLRYKENFFIIPFLGETKYFVMGVERSE